MSPLRAAMSLAALVVATLPLLSVACSGGSTCLRQSDCANSQACISGTCTLASASGEGGDVDGSYMALPDANTSPVGSGTVDAGAPTDAGTEPDSGSAGDASAATDGESDAAVTD